MISITINDEPVSVAKNVSLSDVVAQQDLAADSLALVVNSQVVPRARWQDVCCRQDDQIEVFSVVAGG